MFFSLILQMMQVVGCWKLVIAKHNRVQCEWIMLNHVICLHILHFWYI